MKFLKQISLHLLILDGNGSPVILKAIKLARQFGYKTHRSCYFFVR
jgi:hypothetical protein